MNKKDYAISLILYKYFYRSVSKEEIESELPILLKMTDDELMNYHDKLVEEKRAIQLKFQTIDLDVIQQGFAEIGMKYIENGNFTIVDYQEMIVHYLFHVFFPGHDILLHFNTRTSGQLTIDDKIVEFGV